MEDLMLKIFLAFFMVFTLCYALFMLLQVLISRKERIKYFKKTRNIRHKPLITSDLAPSIDVLMPCYNEGKNIFQSVRAVMSSKYPNYKVIIINDGSKDNSLELLIESFHLVKTTMKETNPSVVSAEIRGTYKSTDATLNNLLVVDNVTGGGKADAVNAGIRFSQADYVLCIDADCILSDDALSVLVRPFMEHSENEVLAVGAPINIANHSDIKSGKIVSQEGAPGNFLVRMQIIEYFRSFLIGRMAYNALDLTMIVSGGLGLFNRKLLVEAGAYDAKATGEDMELIMRMRRVAMEKKRSYKLCYVPDPLCWTEVPETLDIMIKQRSRWFRGGFQALMKHRKMLFNPRYGKFGMIAYPYWILFELSLPVIEFLGTAFTAYLLIADIASWRLVVLLFLLVYSLGITLNSFAIYLQQFSGQRPLNFKSMLKYYGTSLMEAFFFHPVTIYASLLGLRQQFSKHSHTWGEMTRKGFDAK